MCQLTKEATFCISNLLTMVSYEKLLSYFEESQKNNSLLTDYLKNMLLVSDKQLV